MVVGAILICVEENQLFLQLNLSLRNNMDPDEYFSGYNLKDAGREERFGYARKM